ncbi:hypothetical protein, partial [Lautropia dentalis]|uniref:hypothetical protein n=1 Tax=Lautropia dentalis TaxID=2490857 RepID=UPI00193929DD
IQQVVPDITGFKSMLTDKLNSTSNRWIQEVTSIVTGANGGGNSFLERQAQQLAEIMCSWAAGDRDICCCCRCLRDRRWR